MSILSIRIMQFFGENSFSSKLSSRACVRCCCDVLKGSRRLSGTPQTSQKMKPTVTPWDCGVQICDFNLSKVMECTNSNVTSSLISVNPRWLAPEILKETGYSKASDVYRYPRPHPAPLSHNFLLKRLCVHICAPPIPLHTQEISRLHVLKCYIIVCMVW